MNALTSCPAAGRQPVGPANLGPFSLLCAGETVVHDPDLGSWPVQTTLLLGRFHSLDEAMACARRRGRPGSIDAACTPAFAPNLLLLTDGGGRLCLAGQITPTGLVWCAPVASDTEARLIVQNACGLRAQAMAALDQDDPEAARILRFRAAALDARLVDPAWREVAAGLLRESQAA
jgi:hypothetical protein